MKKLSIKVKILIMISENRIGLTIRQILMSFAKEDEYPSHKVIRTTVCNMKTEGFLVLTKRVVCKECCSELSLYSLSEKGLLLLSDSTMKDNCLWDNAFSALPI